MRLLSILFLFGVCALHSTLARSAEVCVDTEAELVTALQQFQNQENGDTYTIRLRQGIYNIGTQLGSTTFHSTAAKQVHLRLHGGYLGLDCANGRIVDPANTIIDAAGASPATLQIRLTGGAGADVEGITFKRMGGGGHTLSIFNDSSATESAEVAVRFCHFMANVGTASVIVQAPRMRVVNTLVTGNSASSTGANVWLGYMPGKTSQVIVSNSTIAHNTGVGLRVDSTTAPSARSSEIVNNILWGNASGDLSLLHFNAAQNPLVLRNNIIGLSFGTLPPGQSNNSAADPQFVNAAAGQYQLALGSPAIDSGGSQSNGFPGRDVGGNGRVWGSLIDRGALESFHAGRTVLQVTTNADNGNNNTPTAGSLRAALRTASQTPGAYYIYFIQPSCPRIFLINTPLPDITQDVHIVGNGTANTTVGKFDADLCVLLNGAGSTAYGLRVASGASAARLTVSGLMFAGFSDAAVRLEGGSNHRIIGNQFGAVPLTVDNNIAIRVTGNAEGTFIGGFDDPSTINLIAGSATAGIYLDSIAGGTTVANNVIGFQRDGQSDGSNEVGAFIFNSPSNRIEGNYIGHSDSTGITISGASSVANRVQYNVIGQDYLRGNAGNAGAGISVISAARDSVIGAPMGQSYGSNTVVGSGGPGVWVTPSGGIGNRVLANLFSQNQAVDIDLGISGPTSNQPSNPATGPNRLQNYPILSSVQRNGASGPTLTVTADLISAPSSVYRIDVYGAAACDSSATGRGAAEFFLGHGLAGTNASGEVHFGLTIPAPPLHAPALNFATAVATSASGDTSEVGNCVPITVLVPDPVFQNGFE
jgi:hypothetical protein